MKDLGHLCFCYLEEHLTTFWKNDSLCVVSVECILFPRLLASGFCTAWQDSRDFFSCFLSSYIARCKAAGGGVAGLGQGVLW